MFSLLSGTPVFFDRVSSLETIELSQGQLIAYFIVNLTLAAIVMFGIAYLKHSDKRDQK